MAPIHPKAMPVELSRAEAQVWLTAAPAGALALQEPLADHELVLLVNRRGVTAPIGALDH